MLEKERNEHRTVILPLGLTIELPPHHYVGKSGLAPLSPECSAKFGRRQEQPFVHASAFRKGITIEGEIPTDQIRAAAGIGIDSPAVRLVGKRQIAHAAQHCCPEISR